jgi:hypothetical protein
MPSIRAAAARSRPAAAPRARGRGRWSRVLAGVLAAAAAASCSPGPSRLAEVAPPEAPGTLDAGDPTITLDPAGQQLLLGWLARDASGWRVWFSRSSDAGRTWVAPVALSPPGEALRPNGEGAPRVTCDAHGRVALLWVRSDTPDDAVGEPSDVRFVRSLDGGRSWSAPRTLADDTSQTAGRQRLPSIVSDAEGRLVGAWLDAGDLPDEAISDEPGRGAMVRIAQSDDFGGHWHPITARWSNACPCCRLGVAIDQAGNAFVASRSLRPGRIRDIMLARPDGAPIRAFTDDWSTEACPHSGPGFTVSRDGTLRLAWYTGAPGRAGVWFREGLPETWDSTAVPVPLLRREDGDAVHVTLGDAGMRGTLIAFDADSSATGRLTLARVESSGRRVVERLHPEAAPMVWRPRLAASNRVPRAFVVWTERDGERSRLRLLRWDVGR